MHSQQHRGRARQQDRAESDGNVCVECNARFARLEHLKRHMVSLHSAQDPRHHQCNLCGKGFSRKDVLLRHQQSCRAEKPDDESKASPEGSRASNPGCHKCTSPACSCNHNDSHGLSTNLALPSPPTDVSQDRTQSTSSLLSSDLVITGSATRQQTDPITTYEPSNSSSSFAVDFGIPLPGSPEVLWSNWTQSQPAESGAAHQGTSTLDEANPGDASSQNSGIGVTDDHSSKRRKQVNKRGRYVPQACINCQKRKIKCSGEETCQQCLAGDEVCIYQQGRKRRAILTTKEDSARPATGAIEVQSASQDPKQFASSLSDVLERVAALEREAVMFKRQVAAIENVQPQGEVAEASLEYEDDGMSLPEFSNDLCLPGVGVIRGPTSLVHSITALNKIHVEDEDGIGHDRHQTDEIAGSRTPSIGWEVLPRSRHKNLATLVRETKRLDRTILYQEIDIFFENLNPHYPCLNEAQFRNSLEEFLAKDNSQDANVDQIQFVALVNLVCAEVKMLHDACPDSEKAPGWDEFCRAETILNSLTWLGNGNAMTIQCLIIKAKYLLYMERSEAAYDAITRAARLCFKLKYSNQDTWSSCSPFEVAMRQRIMWTTFYFERNVALNSGMPYQIREVDLHVDLPKFYNDKAMRPDQPLPDEDPINSYGPCLAVAVKWGKLCAEIWDTMFAVSMQKPVCQELVASIEARILYTVGQLPLHLLWHRHAYRLHEIHDLPLFVLRQSIVLYLRVNQLRLLLRQDSMLSMEYDIKTATECVSIAIGSIDAIHSYINSNLHRATDRFSSVLYLQGAILSLVCIIFKSNNPIHLRTSAIDAFRKGLQLINQLRRNYALARHALSSIHRIIQTTNRAISRFNKEDDKQTTLDITGGSDPLVSFDEEAFEAHMSDLLTNEARLPMPDENILGSTFDGSLSYTLMNPIVHDFNTTNELNALWLDPEFLKAQPMLFPR